MLHRIRSIPVPHAILAAALLAAACTDATVSPEKPAAERQLLELLAERPDALSVDQTQAAKALLATDRGDRLFHEIVTARRPEVVESGAGDGIVGRVVEPSASAVPDAGSSEPSEALAGSDIYTMEAIPFSFLPQPSQTEPGVTTCDDCVRGIDIGFDFQFFGNTYQTLYVSSNGLTGFNPGTSSTFAPSPIPNDDGAGLNNIIAVHWTDLNPSGRGTIRYGTIGTAPKRVLVVQYENVCYFFCDSNLDVQLVLYESSNIIEIHTRTSGADRITQGIENAGGTVAYYLSGRNVDWVDELSEDGVRFTPGPPNHPPAAFAGGPYAGVEGGEVALDLSGTDADGDVLTFAWDMGDGTSGSGPTPPSSHTYVDDDDYTITLIADDGRRATATATVTAAIENVAPSVDAGADHEIYSGDVLDFVGGFHDPGVGDAPWSWTLDWGDGSSASGGTDDASAAITGAHRYLAARDYDVVLSATDKDGGTGADGLLLTVKRLPVEIDVRPGAASSNVNMRGNGLVPVAILSGPAVNGTAFDATRVDGSTVRFGPDEGAPVDAAGSIEDADGDGDDDLVLQFRSREAGIACDDTEATLIGATDEGVEFTGTTDVQPVGCGGRGGPGG